MSLHDLSAEGDVLDRVARLAGTAVGRYGWPEDTIIRLLNLSENATYLLEHPLRGRAVLRVHRLGYHSRDEIESEIAWMSALREQASVRTPEVLPAPDGSTVLSLGDGTGSEERFCVLFEHLPGREPLEQDVDGFVRLGEVTAAMHAHARSWQRPAWFRRFQWDFDAAFGAEARWGRWQGGAGVGQAETAVLGRLERTLQRRLEAFGTGCERFGLIHADTRMANLVLNDSTGSVGIIDFDDCGFGWYLYDLATAFSFFEDRPHVPELIEAWLRGYRRLLDPMAEEGDIWTFILYRRLLLVAWIGSHGAVDVARMLGAGYTAGTCELAESYLSRFA